MSKKIAVIGGGASGLFAAIFAAQNGNSVTIYESGERVGRKILATGNGRCNMTNMNADIENYHGRNPKFIMGCLLYTSPSPRDLSTSRMPSSA